MKSGYFAAARHAMLITALFAATEALAAKPDAVAVVTAKFAAVNRHAFDDVVAFYAEDAVLTASDFCAARRGVADVARTYRAIFAAVPDIQAEVIETVAQGDRVAVRLVLHSKIPGRAFDLPLMNFFTVRGGKIVRDEGIFDNGRRRCTP